MFLLFVAAWAAVKVLEGQTLTIGKVSRLHMGAYLCVASNGIQPSVSKRIQLKVQCEYLYLFPSSSPYPSPTLLFPLILFLCTYPLTASRALDMFLFIILCNPT
ncbi:hypothetical protein E2C01_059466 [Portunus trituberculatus]|uniref:Ig-like domain-containing protein n=1 Tax=Portunus trituberculatus TaxID=210409 RepID=A0A5B7H5F5_PORTR|nr:hypothetical protein [Portunus trituberculatus]